MKLFQQKTAKREPRMQSCEWDGYMFPANSSTHKFCSGTCKQAARNERARADRDAAAAHERWQTGELNNDQLKEELIRVQYMPQSMAIDFQREVKAMEDARLVNQIRTAYGIIKAKATIWLQKRKESIDARVSTPSSK